MGIRTGIGGGEGVLVNAGTLGAVAVEVEEGKDAQAPLDFVRQWVFPFFRPHEQEGLKAMKRMVPVAPPLLASPATPPSNTGETGLSAPASAVQGCKPPPPEARGKKSHTQTACSPCFPERKKNHRPEVPFIQIGLYVVTFCNFVSAVLEMTRKP